MLTLFEKVRKQNGCREIFFAGIKIFSYNKTNNVTALIKKCNNLQQQLDYMKEHCDIFHLKPATGKLREQQLKLVDFAVEFFDKIKSLKCRPILFAGNMIGAVRHQGFIPWDDDLDFLLIRSDYEKIIQWCQKNAVVCYYHHRLSQYNAYEMANRLYKNVKKYPNQYVLDIWYNQMQLSRGTNLDDVQFIDFYSLDYYKDDYSFEKHKMYMQTISSKIQQIDWLDDASKFIRKEIKNNPNIVAKSNKVFFGIDGEPIKPWNTDFMPVETLYPLKKVPFENTMFYVPNQVEKWLDVNFENWKTFPDDVGYSHHNVIKDLYKNKDI